MVKILALSDTHVGAYDGLSFDEPFTIFPGTANERVINPSPAQQNVYGQFMEALDEIGPVDILLLLGDTCEGLNKKEFGSELWASNFVAQAEVTADIFSQIRGVKEIYAVQGSGYHTGKNPSADHIVANMLHATRFGADLMVNIRGVRFHLAHKVGTTTTLNKTTSITKEAQMALLKQRQLGPVDMVLRGHTHSYSLAVMDDCAGMVLPAWKGRDTFCRERSVSMIPDVGMVLFEIGQEGGLRANRIRGELPKEMIIEEVISEL